MQARYVPHCAVGCGQHPERVDERPSAEDLPPGREVEPDLPRGPVDVDRRAVHDLGLLEPDGVVDAADDQVPGAHAGAAWDADFKKDW